ncbi:response regulator [Roseovarius aestuariivivens]|uniref:response regulator n=1 Tax=Roseovarius aestuariivivens TaxID=1888910 RepID=UPI00107FFCF7|nr:response regulator [Roseovarius aestuariivivens]
MTDKDPHFPIQAPTARRPLLGLTILVVEDSLYACETIRLMCLRSGARIRRADCLRSARQHLQVYRPSVVIVDMGLPDGSGVDLIEELAHATPRVSGLLGLSGDPDTEGHARQAGADGFLTKPLVSLAQFQQAVLAVLPPEQQPVGPRKLCDEQVVPDRMAYRDDMNHAASLLDEYKDGPTLDYVSQFLRGVANSAEDSVLAEAARELASRRMTGAGTADAVAHLAGLLRERIKGRVAI